MLNKARLIMWSNHAVGDWADIIGDQSVAGTTRPTVVWENDSIRLVALPSQ